MNPNGKLCDVCGKSTMGRTYHDPEKRDLCPRHALAYALDRIMIGEDVQLAPAFRTVVSEGECAA